ncbi:putative late blight resistance protein R1A-10 isoform X3 [Salvia divinorum]|uniref:Late blight resistance protein R1A-10 isoform X3 n=1 Tax=Salvia divinorum TaxID=28513 RepID=A0ABD1GEI7_SALDI
MQMDNAVASVADEVRREVQSEDAPAQSTVTGPAHQMNPSWRDATYDEHTEKENACEEIANQGEEGEGTNAEDIGEGARTTGNTRTIMRIRKRIMMKTLHIKERMRKVLLHYNVVDDELGPLQQILERVVEMRLSTSRKKVNALDGRINEALWKFENSLESLLTQQIPLQSEILTETVSIDLQSLENDVDSFIHTLKGCLVG